MSGGEFDVECDVGLFVFFACGESTEGESFEVLFDTRFYFSVFCTSEVKCARDGVSALSGDAAFDFEREL